MRSLLLICFVLMALGCGGQGKPYKTAQVSGTVTIDKVPLEKGRINFMGTQGDDSAEIVAGKFSAKEVPLGKVRVYFIASKETGKMIPGSSTDIAETVSIVPKQYDQGLEIEIAANESDRKFDLVNPPP